MAASSALNNDFNIQHSFVSYLSAMKHLITFCVPQPEAAPCPPGWRHLSSALASESPFLISLKVPASIRRGPTSWRQLWRGRGGRDKDSHHLQRLGLSPAHVRVFIPLALDIWMTLCNLAVSVLSRPRGHLFQTESTLAPWSVLCVRGDVLNLST